MEKKIKADLINNSPNNAVLYLILAETPHSSYTKTLSTL